MEFLDDDIANAFCAHGTPSAVAATLRAMIGSGVGLDLLVPHPVPTPTPQDPRPDYMERLMSEVAPLARGGNHA